MKGQQAQTHVFVLVTTTDVALVVPVIVPGSPLPVSPAVSCQVSGASSNAELSGAAVSATLVPEGTQTVCVAFVESAPPLTLMLHHGVPTGAFFTVRVMQLLPSPPLSWPASEVAPASVPPSLPPLLLPLPEPLLDPLLLPLLDPLLLPLLDPLLDPLLEPLLLPLLLPLLEPLPLSLLPTTPPSLSALDVELEQAANWLPAMTIESAEKAEKRRAEGCMKILLDGDYPVGRSASEGRFRARGLALAAKLTATGS